LDKFGKKSYEKFPCNIFSVEKEVLKNVLKGTSKNKRKKVKQKENAETVQKQRNLGKKEAPKKHPCKI
jgi:hypothetical protein